MMNFNPNMPLTAIALWCKWQEIQALAQARQKHPVGAWPPDGYADYWAGKAEGFANVWEYIVFQADGGQAPHPLTYNEANQFWSDRAYAHYTPGETADVK
jgi:hypothetical protein